MLSRKGALIAALLAASAVGLIPVTVSGKPGGAQLSVIVGSAALASTRGRSGSPPPSVVVVVQSSEGHVNTAASVSRVLHVMGTCLRNPALLTLVLVVLLIRATGLVHCPTVLILWETVP